MGEWAIDGGPVVRIERQEGGLAMRAGQESRRLRALSDSTFLMTDIGQRVVRDIRNKLFRDKRLQAQKDFIDNLRGKSKIEVNAKENGETGVTDYTFTCIRCFSWGRWVGKPELAKIGKD